MKPEDFLKHALAPDSHQRRGQKLMNELYFVKPELYFSLHNNEDIDPFYDDAKLWTAVQFVKDNWDVVHNDADQLSKSDSE